MKYYAWLEYYAAPIGKQVSSDELHYFTGHQHGAMPSQTQVNELQASLADNVDTAYQKYNKGHPETPLVAPNGATIQQGRVVNTRSAN